MNFFTPKTLTFSLVCALALVGCNKQEAPKSKDTPKENTAIATTSTSNAASCDDLAVKNSLVRALSVAVNDNVLKLTDSYKNADKLDLARRTQQGLGQISLNLENIRPDGYSCLADMVTVLPTSDLAYADSHYKATGKPSLAELGQRHMVQMNDGRLITQVRYMVQNGEVTLSETPSALEFIANVMSASAYQTANGAGQVNINARPAVEVQPLSVQPAATPRQKPAQREPELPAPSEQTAQATQADTASTDTDNQKPATQAEKTEKPADTKPKSEPKAAPVEGDGELVIVESDETY